MKIIAVICARSKSERFPGKMMADLHGHSLLTHVIYNTQRAKLVDEVVIATVKDDEHIPTFCNRRQIKYYCGEENNIVDRIYRTAQVADADVVVRVWGDSPLVDPDIIDKTICRHFQTGADYTYSTNHPLGQNVAVISMPTLKRTWYEIKEPNDRLWFHKYMIERATDYHVAVYYSDIGHPDWNYSVDTKEDLVKLEEWYEKGYTPDGRPIR